MMEDIDPDAEDVVLADEHCLSWVKSKLALLNVDVEEAWKAKEHVRVASEFLVSLKAGHMFAYMEDDSLTLGPNVPGQYTELLYFVRAPGKFVTAQNIHAMVHVGVLRSNGSESLLKLMTGVYVPAVLANHTWPDSVRKDFTGQLHKFMAYLTELTNDAKGVTVLYIPEEDIHDPAVACKEKELVQRLESTLIHWTRQIKEIVNQQDSTEEGGEWGPLAELDFWRSRSVDLSGIRAQLEHDGIATIVSVLEHAKSSYLDPFRSLSNLIQREAIVAEDNLKFLTSLEAPCKTLAAAEPKDIPSIMPKVLHCIRLIFNVSRFYNTPERIMGLLRKVSNEIITRCSSKISLAQVFDGGVEKCMQGLHESIHAGEEWKRIYHKTAAAINARPSKVGKWDFDTSSIFAHIDAFVQRCKDMLEVCWAQMQFAPEGDLPVFGGTRGPEITKSLKDIQKSFQRLVLQLRGLKYSILDVTATRWHDDYNSFKGGVKDLEVMMQNTIVLAFETVSSLRARVELLEAFQSMAKRESIKRCVERKTAETYQSFFADLNTVKKHFDQQRKNPPIHPSLPRYAGAAMWAQELSRRLEKPMTLLNEAKHFLPATADAGEVETAFTLALQSLEHYIKNQHTTWFNSIDPGLSRKLEYNLIVVEEDKNGLLMRNFDKQLLSVFNEVHYWERLYMEIPYVAMEITSRRELYRVMYENVLLVVRDYNKILQALDSEERKLFSERIAYLDKRVLPGVTKLNWLSGKPMIEFFVKEARKCCREVEGWVNDYKAGNERVAAACKTVSESMLVSIKKKKVYLEGEFEETQKAHLEVVSQQFQKCFKEIKSTMKQTHMIFAHDSDDVQQEWIKYTKRVDRKMEEALRATVKKSLQELSRALNGDNKTEVTPIFNVVLVLEKTNRVELRPTVQDLFNMIHTVSRELITVVSHVPRLQEQRALPDGSMPPAPPSFYETISNDEDTTLKTIVSITQGVSSIVDKVQQCLSNWERKYKHVWDQDKEAYIRRYDKAKKPLSAFDTDISKYKELAEDVSGEAPSENMRFLRVDCAPLKQSLTTHCEAWVKKFTGLLNSNAQAELKALHESFETNKKALARQPLNLDMLADSVNLLKRLQGEREATEARFEPLTDKYRTLERFEVAVTDGETAMLEGLPGEWAAFQQILTDTEAELEKAKGNFRDKLTKMVDGFVHDVAEKRERFVEVAPYNADKSVTVAFNILRQEKVKLAAARKKEGELKQGMDIFNLHQPAYKEMATTEKELEQLEAMWTVAHEWQGSYNGWKDGLFRDLQVEEMETQAIGYSKRIVKLGRDIKHWGVWTHYKETVDSFKKTMPLVMDLRNPAMRPRHWSALMDAVGEQFDPEGEDFTLEKVTELRLDQHAEFIGEMSGNATKELAIEMQLEAIAEVWKGLELDMVPYKDSKDVFKMRSTEDIFAALEDNIVTLSTMKASKYYMVFEKQINYWEQSLSLVSEMIEILLQVQRNWMYLENIFIGSEDIRKQLPQESIMFDNVNATFVAKMRVMTETRNCLRATTAPGMLDVFNDMDAKLEKIQKSLENYLEKKRQQFPRFYFLSSDDLLEILGQAKDPMNVQPHLKKCFEGIKKLDMHKPGTEGRRHYEATGMTSPDTEYIPFPTACITDGRPEEWLNKVEAMMYSTTKKSLYKTLDDAKGMKKEKWVKEFPGMCIITAGQIIWTSECEKALADPETAKAGVRQLKKKWVSYLNKLTGLTRSRLAKVERSKVVSLITIEVHARDVIEKLGKAGCSSAQDFEWVSQLRFYWDKEAPSTGAPQGDCIVKQVLSVFVYGYEYQGNNGRLVMTPLTDRCYMTLGAALYTRRGGNPLGPAGTGKTETVKDFGKALARYVIVFNCSDGVDYKMTGKMFSGLAQTGAWACLDEFNRIEVEVLSVVASQISIVMQAIKEGKGRFQFLGQEIRLIPSCGIFVTMNPGYAGRSELPDNLKAIVRPVSMMVPDFTLIAEIMMFSEGFQTAKSLAKKMIAIMELSQQQLSKQDHYDYGLRSFVIPISRAAGAMKRADPDAAEEVIMYRTMKDLIMPKLVYLDLPLFMALLSDLFPGVELPAAGATRLTETLELELREHNLQVVPEFITKMVQVFDCKVARHGNMIVGKTGSGKSTAWKCLTRAMARLKKEGVEDMERVHVHTINPLALSNDEIYGMFDEATMGFTDGVLAKIMRNVCKDESSDQKWILFDGPVDTLWIESMNTTLDDNKLLTLLSGERISMPAQVSLLFEVEDLSQASPATVSRAGMIYLNVEDLGWQPMVTSWLNDPKGGKTGDAVLMDTLQKCFDRFMGPCLEFRRRECKELVSTPPLQSVLGTCNMFDCIATAENKCSPAEGESYVLMIELNFLFSLVWSVGATIDEEGRKKFDLMLRELDGRFPSQDTVFEYYLDPKTKGWATWESKLNASFKIAPDTPFFKIMVPTVDTTRAEFVLNKRVQMFSHAMVFGNVGVGKTMVVERVLAGLPENKSYMTINMSAQTSSNSLQDTIEGKLEKRTKGVFAPTGGKKLVCFIDDFNMPAKSTFGFLPPLELLKLWVDNGFWYDRAKQEVKNVKDMQLLAAMAPPGGGRNAFSHRVQACFYAINMTAPSAMQLRRIFATMLHSKLVDFDDEIKPMADLLTQGIVECYTAISEELLPTPSKSHYLFNTRDLAKVVQGVMQATRAFYDNKESMLALWCHETFRIYGDRMWDHADKRWLEKLLDEKLSSIFSSGWNTLFGDEDMPPFASFMRPVDNPPYEAINDRQALKDLLIEKLEDYALEPGLSAMDLVLFKDALHHVCRIHRVLNQPRGNVLLVGVGGSGRKSLAKLATYVADLKCFSIEITKQYRQVEFHEDIKTLYRQAGAQNKPTVFLFDDTQIVLETFLEDVNNILTSGEVPNLFTKDEISGLCEDVRSDAKAAGAGETQSELYSFFLSRVRANLHVVLCLSPIGEAFRVRCRMFPGLVNCTTIDWFTEWPADALLEVAAKQLEEENLGSQEVKDKVCQVFMTAHTSVSDMSKKMLDELKRHNYVTPTNYLEFVSGYRTLLREKRKEIGDKSEKLKGGLQKLDETGVQVGEMQVVAMDKKVVVAKAKKDCEELLVEIVQDKRVADEQEKQVNAEATKIAKEADEANAIAAECQAGLDKALPALQEAEDALNVLTKKDMSELKAYAKPPPLVELVLCGVMTALKRPPTWEECKKQLGDANFLMKLTEFDKDQINDALIKKLNKYTSQAEFMPDVIAKVSFAAKGLCMWVRAMEVYGVISKDVAPKRAKLKAAQDALAKKTAQLQTAKDQLAEVLAKVQALKDKYDDSTNSKARLEAELEDLELKLQRAEKLVTGLAGERTRWEASIESFDAEYLRLPGDCVVAAAFMSYAGPFPSEYRELLVRDTWLAQVRLLGLPASEVFDFAGFLANPSDVRDWNIQGLPADDFSTENGVMVTRGRRWPLMIDPQAQANQWIRNMEKNNSLKIIDQGMSDFVRQVENAIQFGNPVLLQDVAQELDPVLEPVLAKNFIKKGTAIMIKLGDKEVDYSPDFRLYITTKLANPHYTPEVSTKATIVNFAVKEQGLEAQLLNTVVKKERPDLDKQKNELVVKVAQGKRTQVELEDQILYMLSTATGSLLDNVELINTLDQSKTTWEEVNESLIIAEETSKKIEAASQMYRPCSIRASVLYFVLNDLSKIDPMYQFSLDAYTDLFLLSIAKSPKSENLQDRIKFLNDYHTYAVYKYTARGLFECHKLLLSLQMCVRILQSANQVNNDEWQFFLRGGLVLDKANQPNNPAPEWISEEGWDNVTALDELPHFKGVVNSFEQSITAWEDWYRSNEPEAAELPGEWESKCNELQRMIFVRSLRIDRAVFASTTYVANSLGRKFVEPPVLDLGETVNDSNPSIPLVFVLSPGVDPTANLQQLALARNHLEHFHTVALGQGQAPVAQKLIDEGEKVGSWVFLANCHLMTSWLPTLAKIIDRTANKRTHEMYRLWLSSNPTPAFPLAILQRAIKMTTEPPKGLRANLARLYNTITDESFLECKTQNKYPKLLFSLAYFHSVLLERRKFRTLGLNIPYDFNDTDFKVSDDLLKSYLDEYEETPWDAIKYLISEANYGGRVTDELDRRVLNSCLNQFYCEDALQVPNYPLSPLPNYYIPDNGPLQSYKDYIATLPVSDRPEAFGQHPNADISYMITDSNIMLDSILLLQPTLATAAGGVTPETIVDNICADLMAQVPKAWILEDVMKAKSDDPSALHVVLFQEIERYNLLLDKIHLNCGLLRKGIKGLVVMSQDLDEMFSAMSGGKIPPAWNKSYPSLKPLGAWTRDLMQRLEQLQSWLVDGYPMVYWLAGFTYPTGFLTAVLQTTARKNAIPIDTLSFEYSIINQDEKDVQAPPKEGVYIKGMFLEGAGWDMEASCLVEPEPMELIVGMPMVHFKPVENKRKASKGIYACPLYMYPVRTGSRERPSYMISVDLKAGSVDPDHWIKRGTAMLLALAT